MHGAVQNGNRFDGPELILMDNDKVVETKGRSTIVITNTGGSDNTAGSGSGQESAPTGPVTANTPIAGRRVCRFIHRNKVETKGNQ